MINSETYCADVDDCSQLSKFNNVLNAYVYSYKSDTKYCYN